MTIGEFKRIRQVADNRPIIARRAFYVRTDWEGGAYLYSVFKSLCYTKATARETATVGKRNGRGLWAVTKRSSYLGREYPLGASYAHAVVALTGRVAIHTKGYRAQKLRILLVRVEENHDRREPLRAFCQLHGIRFRTVRLGR